MELIRELNFKKGDWRRDIGITGISLGMLLVSIDVWLQEYLATTWLHILIAGVITFPLHELVHGLFFKLWTGKVKYGAGMTRFGPILYATSPGSVLSRNRMIVIALAPQALTLLYLSLSYLPLVEHVHIILVLASVVNFIGGVSDFYAITQMLKHSKELRVEDSLTGLKFYMPTKEVTNEGAEPVT